MVRSSIPSTIDLTIFLMSPKSMTYPVGSQFALDAHANLVIVAVQRLAKARIGDEVRGGEFQILLGDVDGEFGLHRRHS